jgi:hypothetical protein
MVSVEYDLMPSVEAVYNKYNSKLIEQRSKNKTRILS